MIKYYKMKTTTLLTIVKIFCWIIFIGLCIKTGALLTAGIISMFYEQAAHKLYPGLDLSLLYQNSKTLYLIFLSVAILLNGMKAYLFYLVIKLLLGLDLNLPFSEAIANLISKIAKLTLFIGIGGIVGLQGSRQAAASGYQTVPYDAYFDDGGAFLLMGITLIIIAHIFNKGLELQNEKDLTI